MKRSIVFCLSCTVLACFAPVIAAQSVRSATAGRRGGPFPPRAEILALMHRVDAYQVANPVMKPGDRNWERGTWYTGVMEAWKATHDEAFLNQALDWGKQNQWQVGTEKLGANRLFCAETWVELYLAKRDPAMIEPTVNWLKTDAPNSPAGARRWYLDGGKPYVDSLYGAAVFPLLARATGNREYLATMRSFFDDVSGELWDKDSGLYYRDPTFIGKRTANGKKILWSRGNGWAFAGIARILEYLPKNDPDRQKYVAIFRRMAGELIKRQGPDGFWRANLDDPEDIPNPESSGTGFFCFGLAWGIHHHLLDRKTYLPATGKAYAALAGAVSPEGKVEWGQQVDSQPHAAQQTSTHEYVTGAFLLASGEVYRLSK
ncbi:MAG: glycoside hydrolase family 88 protein [Acidobacteriota bacterium]|nr:glycoside hydrolase family 88 protein [Acidobacteriota bacterium]